MRNEEYGQWFVVSGPLQGGCVQLTTDQGRLTTGLIPQSSIRNPQSNMSLLDLDGPLGTRASLMMDVVVLAMFLVVPVMLGSIWQVRYRRRYVLHKRVQLTLGVVLGVAVLLFELHVNLHDWQARATGTPGEPLPRAVSVALVVHLCCSIPAALLWIFVIVQGLRQFPRPPRPAAYSPRHRLWGRLAAIEMLLTAVTGWIFYWLAFVA